MTPSAKREVLAVLVQEHGVPVRRACQAVRLSRAAYYRPPRSRLIQDADVVTALNEVVGRHSRWGFWKCFYRLRRAGHRWNHKNPDYREASERWIQISKATCVASDDPRLMR